jgi:hypothetical protein
LTTIADTAGPKAPVICSGVVGVSSSTSCRSAAMTAVSCLQYRKTVHCCSPLHTLCLTSVRQQHELFAHALCVFSCCTTTPAAALRVHLLSVNTTCCTCVHLLSSNSNSCCNMCPSAAGQHQLLHCVSLCCPTTLAAALCVPLLPDNTSCCIVCPFAARQH